MLDKLLADPLTWGACIAIRAGHAAPDMKKIGAHRAAKSDAPMALFEAAALPCVLQDSSNGYGTANLLLGPASENKGQSGPSCFYLPWSAHSACRLSLKGKHSVRLFFTAPLDGCSVVIEGPSEQPVVYHANASKVHPDDSPLGDPSVAELRALQLLEDRNAAMFSACRAFPGSLDSFSDAMNAGAVTPLEYGVLIGRPSEAAERRALESNWRQPQWRARTGWAKEPSDWAFHKSWGAVFGVRSLAGQWAFYRQKVVELKEGAFVLSCQEFWPSGFRRPIV